MPLDASAETTTQSTASSEYEYSAWQGETYEAPASAETQAPEETAIETVDPVSEITTERILLLLPTRFPAQTALRRQKQTPRLNLKKQT